MPDSILSGSALLLKTVLSTPKFSNFLANFAVVQIAKKHPYFYQNSGHFLQNLEKNGLLRRVKARSR